MTPLTRLRPSSDLIICPFLTKRVPQSVYTRWLTLIVHPVSTREEAKQGDTHGRCADSKVLTAVFRVRSATLVLLPSTWLCLAIRVTWKSGMNSSLSSTFVSQKELLLRDARTGA